MRRKPGMLRYLSFGLRIEWMEMFFNIKTNVIVNSSLGPRQKDAFYYYLRDMELIRRNKGLTKFFNRMFIIFKNERIYSNFLWSLLWANLCFNAPLFEWWSIVDTGEYNMSVSEGGVDGNAATRPFFLNIILSPKVLGVLAFLILVSVGIYFMGLSS